MMKMYSLEILLLKQKSLDIIKLSQDQRIFSWASNEAKLMTVPFDENPYSAFRCLFADK
jgi:hypothetical protein